MPDAMTIAMLSPELFGSLVASGVVFSTWIGYLCGRSDGRRQGFAQGKSAGFVEGRRSEREHGVPVPATLVNVRDMASRHHLRLAVALAGPRGAVRLTIDRWGYVVGFRVVRVAEPQFFIVKGERA